MIFVVKDGGNLLYVKDEDKEKLENDPLHWIYRKPPTRWQRFIHWLKH